MSMASRYRQAWSPSSPRISSRKKWGTTRLPMNRPWRSVNMHRTVSTSPNSASSSSCLASSVPVFDVTFASADRDRGYERTVRSGCQTDGGPAFADPPSESIRSRERSARGLSRRLLTRASQDLLLCCLRCLVRLLRDPAFSLRQRELLLWRQHQAVASGDGEVEHAEDVVDGHPVQAGTVVVVREHRNERYQRNDACHGRARNPPLAAVRPLDVRQVPPQQDEREALQRVRYDGTEDRHVEQRRDDLRRVVALPTPEVPDDECHGVSNDGSGDQRHVRGLPHAVRDREELRKVPGARQRERVPAVGVDDCEEARDQTDQSEQRQQLRGEALAEDADETVEQGRSGDTDGAGTAADPAVQEEDERARQYQRVQPPDRSLGDVTPRVHRLLGRERNLLDRQVEPDRERQRFEDPADAVREERPASFREQLVRRLRRRRPVLRDVEPQARVEVSADQRRDVEDAEDRERQDRDRDGEPHRRLDADDVDPDEDDVEESPPDGLAVPPWIAGDVEDRHDEGLHQQTHRADDDRGCDHVLHVLGETGKEPAPRAHRRPRERVRAARVWEGRRHLGDAVTEAVVHDGDENRRDDQAPEARRRQAEVPAVVVAGDDGADAERPEHPHTGMPPEAPLLEVLLVHLLIGDRPHFSLCHVPPLLWRRRTFAAVLSLERVIHVKQTSVACGRFRWCDSLSL